MAKPAVGEKLDEWCGMSQAEDCEQVDSNTKRICGAMYTMIREEAIQPEDLESTR